MNEERVQKISELFNEMNLSHNIPIEIAEAILGLASYTETGRSDHISSNIITVTCKVSRSELEIALFKTLINNEQWQILLKTLEEWFNTSQEAKKIFLDAAAVNNGIITRNNDYKYADVKMAKSSDQMLKITMIIQGRSKIGNRLKRRTN